MLNVCVHRGALVESTHKVIAVVSDSNQNILESYGNTNTIIYPRSSIKPIQALPLVLSGAVTQYNLTQKELAVASASHGGEPFHIDCVEAWLKKLGLSYLDLECGIHAPSHADSAYELVRTGKKFSTIHNNCSGKHTGMLCLAKQLKENTQNYSKVNHKVQETIKSTIEELIDYSIPQDAFGIDGCSIPTWAIPISQFALGLARFADKDFKNKNIGNACQTIFSACVSNPEYIAGTDRFCTALMRDCSSNILVKTGAEGVMAAIINYPRPIGIAVKCVDGTTRAAEAALAFLLNKYKLLPADSKFLNKKIYNWNDMETGFIEVSTEPYRTESV
jgi:L-asparaginase II